MLHRLGLDRATNQVVLLGGMAVLSTLGIAGSALGHMEILWQDEFQLVDECALVQAASRLEVAALTHDNASKQPAREAMLALTDATARGGRKSSEALLALARRAGLDTEPLPAELLAAEVARHQLLGKLELLVAKHRIGLSERHAAVDAERADFKMDLVRRLFLSIPLYVALSVLLWGRLNQWFKEMERVLTAVGGGRFETRLDGRSSNEFGGAAAAFNTMAVRLGSAMQHLSRKESLSALVLKELPIGVMMLASSRDASGTIVDFEWQVVNQAAAKLFNRGPGELPGTRLLCEMPGFLHEGLFKRLVEVVESGKSRRFETPYAHERVLKRLALDAAKFDDGIILVVAEATRSVA